jgi:hypothetical protein
MSIKKCEHCGSTAMSFDPPIELVIGEACGSVKPGTYTGYEPGGIPTCDSAKDHEGDHACVVEYLDRWPQVATPYTEQETTNG